MCFSEPFYKVLLHKPEAECYEQISSVNFFCITPFSFIQPVLSFVTVQSWPRRLYSLQNICRWPRLWRVCLHLSEQASACGAEYPSGGRGVGVGWFVPDHFCPFCALVTWFLCSLQVNMQRTFLESSSLRRKPLLLG